MHNFSLKNEWKHTWGKLCLPDFFIKEENLFLSLKLNENEWSAFTTSLRKSSEQTLQNCNTSECGRGRGHSGLLGVFVPTWALHTALRAQLKDALAPVDLRIRRKIL